MGKRQIKNVHFIKWHTKETVYGSFMMESIESLGFMVKVCCFSANTRYPGFIQSEYHRGMPNAQLASILNVPLENYDRLLAEQVEAGRLAVDEYGVITIVNWEKYQEILAYDGSPELEQRALESLQTAGMEIEKDTPPKEGGTVEVIAFLNKERGYESPKQKLEAKAIGGMLKLYTPAQIIDTWKHLKNEKFWYDKELFMMTVESQIGAIVNRKGKNKNW